MVAVVCGGVGAGGASAEVAGVLCEGAESDGFVGVRAKLAPVEVHLLVCRGGLFEAGGDGGLCLLRLVVSVFGCIRSPLR